MICFAIGPSAEKGLFCPLEPGLSGMSMTMTYDVFSTVVPPFYFYAVFGMKVKSRKKRVNRGTA